MNSRERRTIRIGVAIGTVVGLIGCGEPAPNLQGARHARALSSAHIKSVDSTPNTGITTYGCNAASTRERFMDHAVQTLAP
jgi:hypothetical protein